QIGAAESASAPALAPEVASQVVENAARVLLHLQIDDEQVERARRAQKLDAHLVAIEAQSDEAAAVGASLIHPPALRARGELAAIGELHLLAHSESEAVDAIEGASRQNADRGRRRKTTRHGQVAALLADGHAAAAVRFVHDRRDAGRVAEETCARGLSQRS